MNQVRLVYPDFKDDQPARLIRISKDVDNNPQIGAKSKIPAIPVYRRCVNCDINFPSLYQYQRHECESNATKTEVRLVYPDFNDDQPARLRISKVVDDNPQIGAKSKIPVIPVYRRCVNCDINFPSLYQYQRHECESNATKTVSGSPKELVSKDVVQRKYGKPDYICKFCSKSFKLFRELKQHNIESHEGNKPHICPFEGCSARFRVKISLNDHYRTAHTNERPYKCDICGLSFKTGSVYYQHRLIHTNDRRYECEICGKRFLRSTAVTQHRLTHSDIKPHSCKMCNKRFRQKCDLVKHVKSKHPTI